MKGFTGPLWHPCAQMKDYESFPPLEIVRAQGSYLYTADGRQIIDAISSWWCKSLGHGNLRIRRAVEAQIDRFEHVILANTKHGVIYELAERLSMLMPQGAKVFFGGDGSTAVEIAAKMAVHAMALNGHGKRTGFAALSNGYHGETAFTLAISDLGIYKEPYAAMAHAYTFVEPNYISGPVDPRFFDPGEAWTKALAILEPVADTLAALVVEPIVQGAGGMRIYSAGFLRKLREWTEQHGIFLIADEIMTGFGRTGLALAVNHADVAPDFICLSKGLTSGWAAMSAVLVKKSIAELFYADYGTGKDFLHSNTYAGNAIAAAAALEALKIYEEEKIFERVTATNPLLRSLMVKVAERTGLLANIRSIGMIAAADIVLPAEKKITRAGYKVYRAAIDRGAFLRPLGNTVYWLPPLNTSTDTLEELADITADSLICALA